MIQTCVIYSKQSQFEPFFFICRCCTTFFLQHAITTLCCRWLQQPAWQQPHQTFLDSDLCLSTTCSHRFSMILCVALTSSHWFSSNVQQRLHSWSFCFSNSSNQAILQQAKSPCTENAPKNQAIHGELSVWF